MQHAQKALDYHHLLDHAGDLVLISAVKVPLACPGRPPAAFFEGLTPEDTSTPIVIHFIEANHGITFHHEVASISTESPKLF